MLEQEQAMGSRSIKLDASFDPNFCLCFFCERFLWFFVKRCKFKFIVFQLIFWPVTVWWHKTGSWKSWCKNQDIWSKLPVILSTFLYRVSGCWGPTLPTTWRLPTVISQSAPCTTPPGSGRIFKYLLEILNVIQTIIQIKYFWPLVI